MEAVVAAPKFVRAIKNAWDEALHPRAKDGKFIKKGGFVRGTFTFLDDNDKPHVYRGVARVIGIDADRGRVIVQNAKGEKGVAGIKGIETATSPKANIPPKPRPPALTPEQRLAKQIETISTQASQLPEDPQGRIKILDSIMSGLRGSPLSSVSLYNKQGPSGDGWDDDRRAKHEDLWDAFRQKIEDAGIRKEGKALILGGPPGSGKSTSLKQGQPAGDLGVVGWEGDGEPPEGVTHIVLNPDVIKDLMVDAGMIPDQVPAGIRPREAASVIHAESNFLTKLFMSRVAAERLNVVYDSTMANVPHVQKNIRPLAEAGYVFQGLYVHIPSEESRLSTKKRYIDESMKDPVRGGRFVPSEASGAWDTERTFDHFISWFKGGYMKLDNTGVSKGTPRKKVTKSGRTDGMGVYYYLNPSKAPKTKPGTPSNQRFWETGSGFTYVKPPPKSTKLKPVMWEPGMSLGADDGPIMAAMVADPDGDYFTDTQLAVGMHRGFISPDDALKLLQEHKVLVSDETTDDPESYLHASTLDHEIHAAGRGGLADSIAVEVGNLRAEGFLHD